MTVFPEYKTVSVASLIPYARNSRTHSDAQVGKIAASIREFGFLNPIIVDGANGIIAGHGRVMAAQKLGLATLPVIEAGHLSEAQKRAYIIADNRLALDAGWDNDLLKIELQDLQADGFDLALTGFEIGEIAGFLEEATEGLTDPDAVPDVPAVPVTVEGDVWLLGRHRLMCGDSTSIDSVEKLCDGQLVDMWLTDPPYNVALGFDETPEEAKKRNRRTDGLTVKNDKMDNDSFRQFLRDSYFAADASMKAGAVFYIWHADSEGYNFRGAATDIGWKVRQCLIWRKSSLVMGRQDYQWMHEPCLYGWKEGAGHLWASDRKQTTIFDFVKPSRNGEHPTMKPVELFEYQMLNNTKGSDAVLDSFGGSGTTVIACEKHGRIARLMELDPKYCDVIIKRWQDFTGQTATLEGDGRTFAELEAERCSAAA
jgi:site-specific DNA-methyltransferase (adenine-specific)